MYLVKFQNVLILNIANLVPEKWTNVADKFIDFPVEFEQI